MSNGLLGGIETGGTKIVCAVGPNPEVITAQTQFPTGDDPIRALNRTAEFFATTLASQHEHLRAIGIGSFGPCDPDPDSPTFGFVTSTPKPGWAQADVVGGLRQALGNSNFHAQVPIAFDTDVNAAALGEHRHGAGRGVQNMVYLTIGTGIGGGAIVRGNVVHGLMHPEMGHIPIPRPAAEADRFPGACPYHGDCWEGVASGPAIEARWGRPAQDLPPDHPAWELEGRYLASGLQNLVCVLSPERIVLGGGVGRNPTVLAHARPMLLESLAGYIASPKIDQIDQYLVPTELDGLAGVVGALAMAADTAAIREPDSASSESQGRAS